MPFRLLTTETSVPNSFILLSSTSNVLYSNLRNGQWPMYALPSINMFACLSQYIVVIVKEYLLPLAVRQLRREQVPDTLVKAVVTAEKQAVLTDVAHREVDHVRHIVTPRNINIDVRRVLQGFAGILPVDPPTNVCKLEHRLGVTLGDVDKIFRDRHIGRLIRIELYPRMTDPRVHQDDHLQVDELFDDGVE